MRRGPKPAKPKVASKPPVARKSPKNEDSRVRDLEKRLAEALRDKAEAREQQTATAEILRVIGSSPTNVQPVFDAIVNSAVRLLNGFSAIVSKLIDDTLHLAAFTTTDESGNDAVRAYLPRALADAPIPALAVRDRAPQFVSDIETDPRLDESIRHVAHARGYRSNLIVPMLQNGRPIGVITVTRRSPGPFAAGEIELLQTFADQAVIAIENVRLFTELQEKNRELTEAHARVTEALEQQTATSEVLKVISRSAFDLQPVLESLVENAVRLCGADKGLIYRQDADLYRIAVSYGHSADWIEVIKRYPIRQDRASATGRAVLERRAVHIHDILADPEYTWAEDHRAEEEMHRTILAVPMLREGAVIGVIVIRRTQVLPFTNKQIELVTTFADQAVIAIENVRLFKELEARNTALTESLEQQTATSEILRVISSSPTDVQPVFNTIVTSAGRLCGAESAVVYRFQDEMVDAIALYNLNPDAIEEYRRRFPRRLRDTDYLWRVVDGSVLNIPDIAEHPHTATTLEVCKEGSGAIDGVTANPSLRSRNVRSLVLVPMVREGQTIGAIGVSHHDVGAFSDERVRLLRTFADQAVIAIENVRLFTELQEKNQALTEAHARVTEALEQQTATSEILRVISSSPTNLEPVYQTILASVTRLCDASFAALFRYDGEVLTAAAHVNASPELAEHLARYRHRPSRETATRRAALERRPIHIYDVLADADYPLLEAVATEELRAVLAAPLLRQSTLVGVITTWRREVRPFSDEQVALVQTFADQAVIAIENVRLFKELQTRNADLTDALARQTATSEILRVISSSPTDVQPVFDTIVESAARLCDGVFSALQSFDGHLIHHVAAYNWTSTAFDAARRIWPAPPSRATVAGRAILERSVVHVPDVELDPEHELRELGRAIGGRSVLCVPMLREGAPLGVITVSRAEPGPFSDNQIALLKTFADQAVIAIENVRLFKELDARTQDLTRSVGELRALGEVGQAISSTLDLQTVLRTIVARATQLTGVDAGVIYEYDAQREVFEPRATEHLEADIVQMLVATPVRKGQGATGRLAEVLEPIQVADVRGLAEPIPVRDAFVRAGYRALLAVPLVREDHLIGGLTVVRKTPGEFAPATVDLLRTFATQSAIAIQNARLFREIEEKSRQLEVASRHKSDFLANVSHELRTPMNAILGFNELILDEVYGEVRPELKTPLANIQSSGKHLLRLINNVLDLSKIEAGRMELTLTDYVVYDTVESVRVALSSLAAQKGLDFVTTVPEDLPLALGDAGRITQCLMNLAGNALKFTRQGRVEISVDLRGDLLYYRVTDTGIGIPRDQLETVFGAFRQGDPTIVSEFGGSGLGLSITKKFVEMHGGRVWVESELGQGSIFTFAIPLRVEPAKTG